MAAPTSTITPTDGFRTLGDVMAPIFQVYFGAAAVPKKRDDEPLLDTAAITQIEASIDQRIREGKLLALAGPWAEHRGQTNDVLSVVFEESIEGDFPVATLRVTLHNVYDDRAQRYRYTDPGESGEPLIEYGKTLVLRMGYPLDGKLETIKPVFEGMIESIEASFPADGEPTLEITAVDHRGLLRMVSFKRGRSLRATTVEQLIADVAGEKGLRVAVTAEQLRALEPKSKPKPRTRLTKAVHQSPDQNSLQFIVDCAKRHALELTAFGDVVFVQDPGDVTDVAYRYVYRSGLISFTPRFNATGRPTKATVIARDPETGERFEESVTAEKLRELKLLPKGNATVDLIRESGGAGERELVVTNFAAQDPAECFQLAVALLKRHIDQTFTATGELVGDPRVRVRSTLDIGGTGRWDGFYYVTMSRHRFGANGYQTTFNARRNRALEGAA
jgi:phage protein D